MTSEQSEAETMQDEHNEPVAVEIGWYDKPKGQSDGPFERVYVQIPEDTDEERFAVGDGEVGTVEEHVKQHISAHINGECKCVGGSDG